MTRGPAEPGDMTGDDGMAASGARLRLARQARGFSQQQLAGMAGVSRQAVSAVESGHSDPSLRVGLALARALGMSVEELFGPGNVPAAVTARPGGGARAARDPGQPGLARRLYRRAPAHRGHRHPGRLPARGRSGGRS